jgi:double-stranded uracil-DNA glycosylase
MVDYGHLRLTDRIAPGVRVLFVGINPGVRSALSGHHFAGPSNTFWKLLHESGLVPEPVSHLDDERLPDWGYGVTNIVGRPSPGVNDLTLAELRAGRAALEAKVRQYRPEIVALVGITVYRALFPGAKIVTPGPAGDLLEGARVWVLPNPSGRNAHYSRAQMVEAFSALAKALRHPRAAAPTPPGRAGRRAPRGTRAASAPAAAGRRRR